MIRKCPREGEKGSNLGGGEKGLRVFPEAVSHGKICCLTGKKKKEKIIHARHDGEGRFPQLCQLKANLVVGV